MGRPWDEGAREEDPFAVDAGADRGETGHVSAAPDPSGFVELVVVRHGESTGNERGVFSGWRDLELTPKGREQSLAAGRVLRQRGLSFAHAFSSELRRAVETCDLLVQALGQPALPRTRNWRFNERHCGAMHGLDKEECKVRWGAEKAREFRRSWDVAPPPAERGGPDDPSTDPRYANVNAPLPLSESMGDLARRLAIAFDELLRPRLLRGENLLVVAHGMALRALARSVEGLAEPDLPPWKLASAAPRRYRLARDLRVVSVESIDTGSEVPDE